jgi:hypothetical protein
METLELVSLNVYDQDKDKIRDMIGVHVPFQSPYYLFFSIEDLTDDTEDNVYFVGYEMKASGPAFWGYIDKENDQITIFGSCRYRTNLLNDMVKQWKKNNLKYGGASIRNKIYPRMTYQLNDLDRKYNMTFTEYEEEKYISSYYRGEIERKNLPKDIQENKISDFVKRMDRLDEEGLIEQIKKIDAKTNYVSVPFHGKYFLVPIIITVPDYERYKAFYAFITNKITFKQFKRLYQWEHTLDVMNALMYDFFGYEVEIGSEEYFWEMYENETDMFTDMLYQEIVKYEKNMNNIDGVYKDLNRILNEFFKQIQTRKIKISPTEDCPKISDCMIRNLSEEDQIDTSDRSCMVYYYPYGYKRGNIR